MSALPHSVELEQALIGAVLVSNDAFWLADGVVEAGSFYEPIHGALWSAMGDALRLGRKVDVRLLAAALKGGHGGDFRVGGLTAAQYVARLATEATSSLLAADYAASLRELADKRAIIAAAHLADEGARNGATALDVAAQAIDALDQIASKNTRASPRVSMAEAMARTADATAQAYQRGGGLAGVTWGLSSMNRRTLGLQRGQLTVQAGRPGMAKTAAATCTMRKAAEDGNVCLMVNLEMDDVSIGQRMVADALHDSGRISYWTLREGMFAAADFERIAEVCKEMGKLPITIEQRPNLSFAQIAALARQHKRRHGALDLLIVDHLHLIRPSERYAGNMVAEVGETSAAAKMLAKELDCALLMLSQLSRQVDGRDDKRPTMSDLRWSGSIEQDADLIVMLYRPAYYLERREPTPGSEEHGKWQADMARAHNRLELLIEKQRQGPIGRVEVYCDVACNAVRDLEQRDDVPRNLF